MEKRIFYSQGKEKHRGKLGGFMRMYWTSRRKRVQWRFLFQRDTGTTSSLRKLSSVGLQQHISDLEPISRQRVQETFDKIELASASHLHKLWKWRIDYGVCLRTSPHLPKRWDISFAFSFSCVFSQWKELLETLEGFVSKNLLPKIHVTILGKKYIPW